MFPAYAGVIPMRIYLSGPITGVPRVCGGDPTDVTEKDVIE